MNVSIISSAILFAHFRWKLGQSSLGALSTVSFAGVHLGVGGRDQQKTQQANKRKTTDKAGS